jgi:DNA-binding response OmpR family regulator
LSCRRWVRVPKILLVEDDPAMRDVVKHALLREGMETLAVGDGEAALERLRGEAEPFDLVVLDVMLPGIDGINVCREIRTGEAGSASSDVPIVMLTARDDEINVVVGLEVGADDYITKPFRPSELVSRVRAHLRRRRLDAKGANEEQRKLEFPGLEVDLLRRQAFVGGKPVALTVKEFEVLALLASHPGWVYSREQVMRHLYGGDFFGEARAADVHVQHIRKKIEPDPKNPRYVQTVRGFGYKFAEV